MRLTSKRIGKEIEARTGVKGIKVLRSENSFYFSSDLEEVFETLGFAQSLDVSVFRMNHQTLDQWVSDFESVWSNALINKELAAESWNEANRG